MKLKSLYIFWLILLCCSAQLKTAAQFYGVEFQYGSDGNITSLTIWLEGGSYTTSVTTNTQGVYTSTGQPTYCLGCYATEVYGYYNTTQSYAPGQYNYQPIQWAPPTNYYSSTVQTSLSQVIYRDANGNIIDIIPFGQSSGHNYGVVGFAEGCGSCAQVAAQQQASNQWSGTNLQNYQNQSPTFQLQILAAMQQQMNDSYNSSNTYNYYYYYYAIQQLTGNSNGTNPLPPPPPKPPLPGPPNEKEAPLNTDDIAKLPAALGGNRTYVAPNGTPIILPPNAQVGGLRIDFDDFPNGALYSFFVDGVEYRADEQPYIRNSAVGDPKFRGYYQVNPSNNKCDLTKPYIPTEQPSLSTNDNTTLPVVRIQRVTTPTGCSLLQEIVSYTVYAGSPTTIPVAPIEQNHNTSIQYSTVVSGAPTNSIAVKCASSGTGGTNILTIDTWANGNGEGGISRLQSSLNVHTKNTVKVYLYDCATGTVKYTVTKSEYKTLTSAEQATETAAANAQFNNNNFAAGAQDFVIKGCLDANGKWNYDVKLNPNSIANPHPKAAGQIQEIKDELKRQSDAEIQESKLKNGNSRDPGEVVTVETGEVFSKDNMNIFEAISAIYDIGKDIINEGKMPDRIWDRGYRAGQTQPDAAIALEHSKAPLKMPSYPSGLTDEIINNVTGILQLVKTGIEFLRHPRQTFGEIWNSVRSLNGDKIQQMISSMLGITNMQLGGDRAKYQTGVYTVQAATIFLVYLKATSQGRALVKGSGDEMTNMQKFVPDGSQSSAAGAALKNATDNGMLAKVIDQEKMITKNVVSGETRFVSIDKAGDVYNTKATNNVFDEVSDDVKIKADAGDLAEGADDNMVFTEMKTQPQRFKDGKDFEIRMANDPSTKISVGNKAGIDLSTHTQLRQVQLKTTDGDFFIADEVYVKFNTTTNKYDVVVNEAKLSSAAPFTTRQNKFMSDLQNGTAEFELRNIKFNNPANGNIPQGTMFNIKAFIKTEGNGTVNGAATFLKYNPATNSWQ